MSPRHCLLFAETKSEGATEKNNRRRGGEDGKIRSRRRTTLRPGMRQECVTADRDRQNSRMASAKSRPEITRLPLEAIGAIAIYRIRAAVRQRSGLLSLSLAIFHKNGEGKERRVRRELELKS